MLDLRSRFLILSLTDISWGDADARRRWWGGRLGKVATWQGFSLPGPLVRYAPRRNAESVGNGSKSAKPSFSQQSAAWQRAAMWTSCANALLLCPTLRSRV